MRSAVTAVLVLLWFTAVCPAQSGRVRSRPSVTSPDISGMYSFVRDGEFVQVTVEAGGAVSGFVSRYGDTKNDKGMVLDHFFDLASYDGQRLSFHTQVVHGTTFDFSGDVIRGPVATPAKEGYWILKGTLTETKPAADGQNLSRSRSVEFKSFPRDIEDDVSGR